MTAQEHNRLLGIAHTVYGGVSFVLLSLVAFYFALVLGLISHDPEAPAVAWFLFALMAFVVLLGLSVTGLSLAAGIGLLKRKGWARTIALIAGAVAALNIPFGTALAIYTFWFLLGEEGKALYSENSAQRLSLRPPAQSLWQEEQRLEEQRPPDWRS